MPRSLTIVLTVLSVGLASRTALAQASRPVDRRTAIDSQLEAERVARHIPALSVGVVCGDALAYASAFGVADRATSRPATIQSVYRVASFTKVFTAALLVSLRDAGVVKLDDPVARHLPAEVSVPTDPRGAPHITLRHLATHTSGLPRVPDNLHPKAGDMYGGYTTEQLYAALRTEKLDAPIGAAYAYSNFGMGLLGHALERAAGKPFETLLIERLFAPLGMNQTRINISPDARGDYATGYLMFSDTPAVEWDFGCLAGCGAVASSVPDLARFVSLQFRAGEADVTPLSGGSLLEMHTPQRMLDGGKLGVGLGWHMLKDDQVGEVVWHNGGTFGHGSFVGFSPTRKLGVVILMNRGNVDGAADEIGLWLLRDVVKNGIPPLTSQPAAR